ncbi:MAG: hypothetical protein V4736_06670 [Bdellovibrionota bacterium]
MLDKTSIFKLNQLCRSHGWEVIFNPLSIVGNSSGNEEVELTHEGHLLGKARLQNLDPSKKAELGTVKEIVELYLQPKLYRQYLEAQEGAAIHQIAEARNFRLADLDMDADGEKALEDKVMNHVFIMMKGSHYPDKKFADDVHELTKNWAFIEQGGMSIDSAEELIKMGPVTWYIPEPTAKDLAVVQSYLDRKADINEWATIVMGKPALDIQTNFSFQPVDLRLFPVQPGLRRDVIRLLLGVS